MINFCRPGKLAILSTAVLLATSTTVVAQRYQVLQPRMDEARARSEGGKVAALLRSATSLNDAQKKQLDSYFLGYFFPRMTRTDAESLGELAEDRQRFFRQYMGFAKSEQVRNHLVKTTFKAMGKIALGNYHPAARYNAILAIGMLDETPATTGNNATPPVPLPAATNALIMVLTKDEINKVKVPVSAKVGALVGLERHARFGISDKLSDQVTQAAMQMIAAEDPPKDTSADVHHWMKCQAARVLANQAAGDAVKPEVHQALLSLVANPDMSLDDRCCAAKLLKKIQYEGAADVDIDAAALTLGELASTVLNKAVKVARDYEDEILEGGGGMGRGGFGSEFGGGYGGAYSRGGAGGDTGPKLLKRRFLSRLDAIVQGAKSLAKASDDAQTKLIQLYDPIDAAVAKATKKNVIDTDVADAVRNLATQVADVVDAWKPKAPATDGEAEEDFS